MFTHLRNISVAAGMVVCAVLSGPDAQAQTVNTGLQGWFDQPTMTGNWGGERQTLAAEGINLRAGYLGEAASVVEGGIRSGTRYAQQIGFGADFNMAKFVGWNGAFIRISFTDRAGRNVNELTGSRFGQNEIYGQGQNFRVSEISLEQQLWSKALSLKAGFYPFANEFGVSTLYFNYLTSAVDAHIPLLSADSGWSNGPRGDWTARARLGLGKNFYLIAAISAVNNTLAATDHGFRLDLAGATGVIVPVEAGWVHGNGPGQMPGNVKIGGYYDSSHVTNIGNAKETVDGRSGGYIMAQQMVYRERADSIRGLTLFTAGALGDRVTSPMRTFELIGASYQGTFPKRDTDTVNFAFINADVNSRFLERMHVANSSPKTSEKGLELNYGYQIARWMVVRPSIEYVIDPGAFAATRISETYRNALVLALQVKAVF